MANSPQQLQRVTPDGKEPADFLSKVDESLRQRSVHAGCRQETLLQCVWEPRHSIASARRKNAGQGTLLDGAPQSPLRPPDVVPLALDVFPVSDSLHDRRGMAKSEIVHAVWSGTQGLKEGRAESFPRKAPSPTPSPTNGERGGCRGFQTLAVIKAPLVRRFPCM